MALLLRMPEVAANATEAVLSAWLVDAGASFAADDTVATVETEKAVVDIEAGTAGVLVRPLVPPGASVEVGSPIALLADVGEEVADVGATLAELGAEALPEHAVPERRDVPEDPGSGAPVAERPPAPTRVFSSPLARKLAKDGGLAIEQIEGTGPRGRVLRRDVDAALERRAARSNGRHAAAASPTEVADVTEVPHTRLRRAIARRLVESTTTAPHFYVRATVRVDRLMALRAELNEGADLRVSVNDLVVKAVGAAHARVPEMNVTWTPDAVRRHRTADVAVAVATDGGLLTPVVRDVGSLTVSALAAATSDLAIRAREGRLRQDELEGGTISVSNLGGHGVEEFAAIINPPHAAILAVGAVREAPVVEDGALVVGRVLSLTLSVDHRPVDGVLAARWMAALTEMLERPVRLLA